MANKDDNTVQTNNKTQGQMNQNRYFVAICLAAGLILICLFIYLNINRTYSSYKKIDTYARKDNNTKEYLTYDTDKMIKYSNDGITAIGTDGKSIWSYSFEMKNPKAVVCEKYVAVADIGGTEAYIFDEKGNESKVENVNIIDQVEVSARGQVAILVEDGMADFIKICDGTTNYIDIKTRVKEDGYPLDMAFSNDSKKLVTSYMCIEEGNVNNKITCYNLGEVGKNYESKIVAAFNYEELMAPKIEFMDSDTFVIYSENNFAIYSMKEKPEEKFKTDEFKYKIESIFYSKDYVGVILDNNIDYKKEIIAYGMDGKIKLQKDVEYEYDNIYLSGEDIVMYTNSDALIENISGYTKFKGSFDVDIEYILPYNNKDKFFFITSENILKVKLTEGD